ncbi:MAG TPA: 23S rRNA (uracil(1939)-C(5))-methyltransferase RlmD [Kofleriaceae bacterium]|nr:23S rRNA (uracil(1939)-C(5))-methyltransferase RlmD [Kofleriaceae bacterium]
MNRTRCEVTASSLDDAGLGVGTADGGLRVHVQDLLPGERAEVAVDHSSPHKPEAWGRIVRRIGKTSEERVEPACPAFGRCGGCVWQHLAYPAQLAAKRARVVEALGNVGVPIGDVRPSPSLLGYRNKGKYVVGRLGNEAIVLGAYAPRSHNVIDTIGCRVVAPVIDEVATWVRGAAERAGLVPYEEATRAGELRYVVLREAGGDVMVALVVTSSAPRAKLEKVASALSKHPAVRGLVSIVNDRRDGAIIPSGSSSQVLYGHGHLVEELAGVKLVVGAAEFLQVNRPQATNMYERVAQLAAETHGTDLKDADALRGVKAVDLFAGLGGFGLHMARAGAEVVAVEIDRDAISQLRKAAQRASLALTPIAGDAGDLPAEIHAQLGTPSVVVVNPPRKGLSEGARRLLGDLGAATVIYVSCGPESLGRDLAVLAEQGWKPDVIEPFDLMPGTAQVETIVRLRR